MSNGTVQTPSSSHTRTLLGSRSWVLLYRDREPSLEIAETGRPWTFDGDGKLFRLVTEALLRKGYSEGDIRKILGENPVRVMEQAERVSRELQSQ